MSRSDEFEHGGFSFEIPQRDLEFYRHIGEMSRLDAAMERHIETRPAYLDSPDSLREHLINAHDWHPKRSFVRDEVSQDIPGMSPIDWDKANETGMMPDYNLQDMRAHHAHEHAEYDDWHHTTHDGEHFHH